MIQRLFQNILRRLLPLDRYLFRRISKGLGLSLDYAINKDAVAVFEAIFIQREYAPYFPFYEKAIIVDIGAHYGYFSLFAAMNSGRASRIYAIEPSQKNIRVLEKNIAASGFEQIRYINKAIASHSGEATLYGQDSFNYSTLASNDKKVLQKVDCITLADLFDHFQLQHIDFLKLDCEGAEYDILLNSPTNVLKKIQTIVLEFHDLRQHNYRPGQLLACLDSAGFIIQQYTFDPDYSASNLNFGKIIATQKIKVNDEISD